MEYLLTYTADTLLYPAHTQTPPLPPPYKNGFFVKFYLQENSKLEL